MFFFVERNTKRRMLTPTTMMMPHTERSQWFSVHGAYTSKWLERQYDLYITHTHIVHRYCVYTYMWMYPVFDFFFEIAKILFGFRCDLMEWKVGQKSFTFLQIPKSKLSEWPKWKSHTQKKTPRHTLGGCSESCIHVCEYVCVMHTNIYNQFCLVFCFFFIVRIVTVVWCIFHFLSNQSNHSFLWFFFLHIKWLCIYAIFKIRTHSFNAILQYYKLFEFRFAFGLAMSLDGAAKKHKLFFCICFFFSCRPQQFGKFTKP